MLQSHWFDPFTSVQQDLVCLSTGKVAPRKIQQDLLTAEAVGEKAYESFRVERLESQPLQTKFHETIPKARLQTFTDLNRKVQAKSKTSKEIILNADRNPFAQMILIAENQKRQMREVLSHPLGPLLWSLSTTAGSLRKTNKAALAKELQKSVSFADVIPQPSSCMIDAMALVQRLKGDHKTFAQVVESLLSLVLHEGSNSKRTDVIFDEYKENSIKNAGREKREAEFGNEFKNIQSEHKVQQWRKLLLNPKNKKVFTEFWVKEWRRDKYRTKLTGKILFVTCEVTVTRLPHTHSSPSP